MEEQIQQLQRRVNEQILERAEADPQWRQQFLDDPDTATAGIPEARQIKEMGDSVQLSEEPPQATMPTTAWEEYRQVQRSLAEKILDRAVSDPTWKQQLLDNPEAAIRQANFPEIQQLEQMRPSAAQQGEEEQGEEVRGHYYGGSTLSSTRGYNPDYLVSCRYQCVELSFLHERTLF